jgi:hypothetical protein
MSISCCAFIQYFPACRGGMHDRSVCIKGKKHVLCVAHLVSSLLNEMKLQALSHSFIHQ